MVVAEELGQIEAIETKIKELLGYGNRPDRVDRYTQTFMEMLRGGYVGTRGFRKEQVALSELYEMFIGNLDQSLKRAKWNKDVGIPVRVTAKDVNAIFFQTKQDYRYRHRYCNRSV